MWTANVAELKISNGTLIKRLPTRYVHKLYGQFTEDRLPYYAILQNDAHLFDNKRWNARITMEATIVAKVIDSEGIQVS